MCLSDVGSARQQLSGLFPSGTCFFGPSGTRRQLVQAAARLKQTKQLEPKLSSKSGES